MRKFYNAMYGMCFDAAGNDGDPGAAATGGSPATGALAPDGGTPPAGTPPAGGEVKAPWSGAEGVYKFGEGETAQPWWSGISEEPIRQYMDEKQYATPDDAARAAWNAHKNSRNPNAVEIPGENATPEEVNAFYSKLGRPETPEGYEFKFDEGVQVDDKMMDFGKKLFHKLGADPKKAQEAANEWNAFIAEYNSTSLDAERDANEEALSALTQKWESEEKLNEMSAAGQRAAKALGLDNAAIEAIEANIGSAAIVELMAKIGAATQEGTFKDTGVGSGDPNDPANMTADQAQAAITKLEGDDEFQKKYTDKNHPEHKNAVDRMQLLFAKAHSKS